MNGTTTATSMNATGTAASITSMATTSSSSSTSSTVASMFEECESLVGKGLTLSSTNNSTWSKVHVGCDEFGHRPSGGIFELVCLNNSKWDHEIPSCEWSWDFTTQEKIIFGTAVAAGSFIIVVLFAVLIAYFCCGKKRKDEDEKIYDSSYHGSSNRAGYDGPYQGKESYPITYLAYQDVSDGKSDGYVHTGTLDKPWLGYIPRPKVTEGNLYN